MLEMKKKEDTKKRKLFSELKAQMEHEMKVSVVFLVLKHCFCFALGQVI